MKNDKELVDAELAEKKRTIVYELKYLSKIACEGVNSIRHGFTPCLLCIEYEREDSQ